MNCLVCEDPAVKLILEEDEKIYWKCRNCLFISLDPKFRLSSSEEKDRYKQHNNDIYDANYRLFLSKLFKPLQGKLQDGVKGLDFGCGPGPALAEMFKEAGYQVDLYDPFFFNNEMDDFSVKPGTPNFWGLVGNKANAIEPNKRPLSSMTPTILMYEGIPIMTIGSPGGSKIITTVLQCILNVIVHYMNIKEAVCAPRIHHQW